MTEKFGRGCSTEIVTVVNIRLKEKKCIKNFATLADDTAVIAVVKDHTVVATK